VAKRSHPKRGKPAKPPAAAPTPTSPPAASPPKAPTETVATGRSRGWWWLEISWAKLVFFRFVFFGLLSVDAFLQLPHASRYGAGGFNVPHLSWLPLPEPGRASITFAHGAMCILFALVAQGALVRVALPLATMLYGWAYFSSQLDSYQHHYLMWLLLVILCFAPRAPDPLPKGAVPDAPRTVASWAIRLALVQCAIVYLWAAIAKIDALWLDGTALFIQVKDGWVRSTIESIGFDRVSLLVLASELFLAVTVWNRKLWLPAIGVGVGMHVGIELVDLDIGLFSYLMIAVYLLLVPELVYTRASAWLAPLRRAKTPPFVRLAAWPAAVAALVATYVLVPLPLGAAIALAGALFVVGAVDALLTHHSNRGFRTGWAFAVAAIAPLAVHTQTETADDYYRYWAGSSRRLGDEQDARRAYTGLLEVDPSSEYAHYYLGKQDADAGKLDAALAHFDAAQRSMPARGRAYFGEAEVHLRKNDPESAKAALVAGLAVEDNPQMQTLLSSLGGTAPTAPNAKTTSDDD
jgi:hypothetical protein